MGCHVQLARYGGPLTFGSGVMLVLPQGPWIITDTVHSDRKNLFDLSPNSSFHIGTIVSGSRNRLDRFSASLRLIERLPEMHAELAQTLELLEGTALLQSPVARLLAKRIRQTLEGGAATTHVRID